MNVRKIALGILLMWLCCSGIRAQAVDHYVFFGQHREKIKEASSFLETKALAGAQVTYSWRQLEPEKDKYDFSAVREDLEFLTSKGKKLFIQLQDVTFSESRINVPRYLLSDAVYNGGADKQYETKNDNEENAVVAGWAARRWDPAVQERVHKLLFALGKEFDGRIEGINFAETSVGFGQSGRLFPKGFSFEIDYLTSWSSIRCCPHYEGKHRGRLGCSRPSVGQARAPVLAKTAHSHLGNTLPGWNQVDGRDKVIWFETVYSVPDNL